MVFGVELVSPTHMENWACKVVTGKPPMGGIARGFRQTLCTLALLEVLGGFGLDVWFGHTEPPSRKVEVVLF